MPKDKDVSNQEIKITVDKEMSKSKSGMTYYSRSARVATEESEEGAKAWVRRHEQILEEKDPTAGCLKEDMIHSVPTVMLGKVDATKLFYPAVIGMGPLHFRCSEDVGASTGGAVRRIKEEALSLIMERHPLSQRKTLMGTLLSLICEEEDRIKLSYGSPRHIPHFLKGEVFAWVMVVDACFLLVALSILSSKTCVERDKWPALALLQDKVSSRAGDLLQDLLKMENQIPLWVVKKVAEHLPDWKPEAGEISKQVDMETVLTKLSPFCQSTSGVSGSSTSEWRECYSQGKGTLLYVLLLFIIGGPQNDAESEGRSYQSVPVACKRALDALGWIIPVPIRSLVKLSWEMLKETGTVTRGSLLLPRECPRPFHLAANIVRTVAMLGLLPFMLVLLLTGLLLRMVVLLCLPLLLAVDMWRQKQQDDDDDEDHDDHKGTRALANSGVSIYTAKASKIISVHWTQDSDGLGGKLQLPVLRLDEVAMVTLWNMLILENGCPKLSQTKSLSNYISLMSCVLASFDDLEPLRRKGVIDIREQRHRPNQLMLLLWLDLKNSATIPEQRSTDDGGDYCTCAIRQTRISFTTFLRQSRKPPTVLTRMKHWLSVLGNEYGSSPWVALSTVGAIMLLLMTAAQVLCLFYPCIGKEV